MATVLKQSEREYLENPGKIDHFRLFSDVSGIKKGINPKNLNFDLRKLNPGQFSAPYHFHRYSEELFMVQSGTMTLRTPAGLEVVNGGDVIFFEMGETGAHQFYNHGTEPCLYLDIRTFIGYDVCEYPDSGKLLLAPSFEIFAKDSNIGYFEEEEDIVTRWNKLAKE
jgi:uncharacterized cupin superfamily protein